MTASMTIFADLTDVDGFELGRTIPVEVIYKVEIDQSYGADADGNRGVLLQELVVTGHYIDPRDLMTCDSGQVERLLASADAAIAERFSLQGLPA